MGIVSLARVVCCWKKCRLRRMLFLCTAICIGVMLYSLYSSYSHLLPQRKPQKQGTTITTQIMISSTTPAVSSTGAMQTHEISTASIATITTSNIDQGGTGELPRSTPVKTIPHNIYWPEFQFKLLSPEIEPVLTEERKYFLLVVINSAASGEKHFLRRQMIRKTWGNNTCSQIPCAHHGMTMFAMGKAGYKSRDDQIGIEAQQYNDVLVGDFEDIYSNLLIKTFMSHIWAARLNCRYILKTDDDVYVRVPQLISWLTTAAGQPSRFYGGHVYKGYGVGRILGHKWCISKKYYDRDLWPPFCSGAFHVLSSDLIAVLANHTRVRRPFPIDDAYLGVAASDLNITAVNIPGFDAYVGNSDLCTSDDVGYGVSNRIAIGHKITPSCMERIHNSFTR